MKRTAKAISLGLGLVAGGVTLFATLPDTPGYVVESAPNAIDERAVERLEEQSYSFGTKDDPAGRANFRFERLRSPLTGQIPENIKQKEQEFARRLPVSNGLMQFSKDGKEARTQETEWTGRGPINIGGRTRAVGIDVADASGNTIIAGGVSGGMWRSTNGGQTWIRTTTKDQFPSVNCLVQDSRTGNTSTWYYGTGESTFFNSASKGGAIYRGDGIYRSDDGGQSWTVINSTSVGHNTDSNTPFRYVNHLAIDPTTPAATDEVYAAVLGGIIRTVDGFNTYDWVLGGDQVNALGRYSDIKIDENGRMFASISRLTADDDPVSGFFVSVNGTDWTDITPDELANEVSFDRTVIEINPSNPDQVYFFTNISGENNSLLVLDMADTTYANRSNNLPQYSNEAISLNLQGSYNMLLEVHPTQPDVVFLGGTNLYRSTDGFRSDSLTQYVGGYSLESALSGSFSPAYNHHPDQHAVIFYPNNPNAMLSAHDGGLSFTSNNLKADTTVYRDEDNQVIDRSVIEWDSKSTGYLTSQFYTIAIDKNNLGNVALMGGMQDNSCYVTFTEDPSSSWFQVSGGDGAYAAFSFNALYSSSQYGYILRWPLVGNTYQAPEFILPPGYSDPSEFLFVNPFLVDPVHQNRFYVAGNNKIFYTKDVRTNPFESEYKTIANAVTSGMGYVTAMDASITPANQLVWGTNRGRVFKAPDVLDNPNNVEELTDSSFPTNGFVSCVVVDPRDADKIMVVFSNYGVKSIYYSQNGGTSWVTIAGNLEENSDGTGNGPSVGWVAILPNGDDNIYFAGTSVGLFSTQNLDASSTVWSVESPDVVGNVWVDMIATRAIDGYVAVGTHGNGTYYTQIDVPLFANAFVTSNIEDENEAIELGSSVSFDENNGLAHQWQRNGEDIAGANSDIYNPTEPGTYRVVIRNARNETAISNEIVVGGNDVTGLEELELADEVVAFPNPVHNEMIIRVDTDQLGNELEMKIYDTQGKTVWAERAQRTSRKFEERVELGHLPLGSYILEISDGESRVTRRISKK
ncbi:T9SS type A sorting domain-containing protein [Roseivirga sp. BDSF3-8]|uniref:T9SS type A sorting domain-containing protein n=1 Tax=Roseivirga sp. BDSF3-8 TaxID=3241598 RepID=UPI003531B6C3